jgi:hypothetical protein
MDNVQRNKIQICNAPSSISFKCILNNRYGPGVYSLFRKLEQAKIHLAKTHNHITFLMRCKSHHIIPKGLLLIPPFSSYRSSRIATRASQALLRERLQFHRFQKFSHVKHIELLERSLRETVNQSDLQRIFSAVKAPLEISSRNRK